MEKGKGKNFVIFVVLTNLKKQSQFAGGQNGVSSYLKGSYGYIAASGAAKNKPNSKPIVR